MVEVLVFKTFSYLVETKQKLLLEDKGVRMLNGFFFLLFETGKEKANWDLCNTVREWRVSLTETTHSSLGHYQLSSSHEKPFFQGTYRLQTYVYT